MSKKPLDEEFEAISRQFSIPFSELKKDYEKVIVLPKEEFEKDLKEQIKRILKMEISRKSEEINE